MGSLAEQSEGKVNAQKAFMTGQLKVKGNVNQLPFGLSMPLSWLNQSIASFVSSQIMFAVSRLP